MTKHLKLSSLTSLKDYVLIIFGLLLYALGFSAFILPHQVVMGGLTGVGTLVYYATGGTIPVGVTFYVCNLILLAFAFKVVGRTFVLRTIFGVTVMALGIGVFESFFMGLGHPIIADPTMSIVIGATIIGLGVGTVFIHNGSTGGTDIVAAMMAKVSNVSFGRVVSMVDMTIVSSSILLPFDGDIEQRIEARIPTIVYGLVVTFIIAYCSDTIINTNRKATQFIIFSSKWREIADMINTEAHRGVTVLDGMGWYSKKETKMLMVWCRRIEQVNIFRIVKAIDENAFITQGAVNGVYGKGFDTMHVKVKKRTPQDHHELGICPDEKDDNDNEDQAT